MFLPGHAELLSALPDYIVEWQAKNQKNKRTLVAKVDESTVQGSSQQRDHSESRANQNNTIQEHEANTSNEKDIEILILKEKELKEGLIKKLAKFAKSKNFTFDISEKNIENFRFENNIYRCKVQCSVCVKKVPCTFTSHWVCSNLQAHLKSHLTIEEYEVSDNSQLEKISEGNLQNSSRKVLKLVNESDKHLNSLLND